MKYEIIGNDIVFVIPSKYHEITHDYLKFIHINKLKEMQGGFILGSNFVKVHFNIAKIEFGGHFSNDVSVLFYNHTIKNKVNSIHIHNAKTLEQCFNELAKVVQKEFYYFDEDMEAVQNEQDIRQSQHTDYAR